MIEFALPAAGRTSLTVYNQIGQAVRTLVDGQLTAGKHRISFDGRGLPNGAYFYRLTTPDGAEVRKLLLVR
ncbi:MAG: T9SS type A sorting domain-containing protein [Candidatus Edwardsbacteria bacterium]|nr:T9SS type A sorting domain-containing protein [Candidatus Edwardsbacteria bacterium]